MGTWELGSWGVGVLESWVVEQSVEQNRTVEQFYFSYSFSLEENLHLGVTIAFPNNLQLFICLPALFLKLVVSFNYMYIFDFM